MRRDAKLLQIRHTIGERQNFGLLPAKEHTAYYNAKVRFLLSLDEGTTSARAALYNEQGRRIATESAPLVCAHPNPGWVEQDAQAIWTTQLDAARRVLASKNIRPGEVAAIGITNQRETTIVWDASTGEPIAPAIVWQCRRTAEACALLAASPAADAVTRKTGLVIDAYFSASKIRWILDHVPDAQARARDGALRFGTVDTWLLWNLTNGAVHATDVSNASRTMLMNLESGDWDPELLSLFDIPRAMLPRIIPSSYTAGVADASHLGFEVPICGIAGDQQSALFGQACLRPGLSKNTYGTGCFALMHTGSHQPVSRHKLLATRAASLDASPQFAIEGSIFTAGAAIQWLRDKLILIPSAAATEAIAESASGTDGVYFVPAFVGLGAPYWDPNARATLTGVTLATEAKHVVRATLEGIAYQVRELVEAMEADSGEPLRELRVDGGAAANNFLMQFQADILGKPIVRPADAETTALGAAYLAGLACGYFPSVEAVEANWSADRTFEPRMPTSQREDLYAGWKHAVAQCRAK